MGLENTPLQADSSPFRNMKESETIKGQSSTFCDLPDHPELVVRKSFIPLISEHSPDFDYAEASGKWGKMAKEFRGIGEKYGIRIAKTDYIAGIDPLSGQPSLFAVTERIEGEDLENARSLDKSAAEELDEMYAGLFFHVYDAFRLGGNVFKDFKNSQVVYGKAPGETEPHPYIVDVDLYLEPLSFQSKGTTKDYAFWEYILCLVRAMKDSEGKIGKKKTSFAKARTILNRIKKEAPVPGNEKAKGMRFRVQLEN